MRSDLRRALRYDLRQVLRYVRDLPGYLYGLLLRFLRQFLLAAALFLVTSLLVPDRWGPALSVTLPFAFAFAPFVYLAHRMHRQLRSEEARTEMERERRERTQLLELAKRHGVPVEVFAPLQEQAPFAPEDTVGEAGRPATDGLGAGGQPGG